MNYSWMYSHVCASLSIFSFFYLALRRKLETVAKEKDCELVGEWMKSVINHLYWSAVSTPSGDGDVIKVKWLSVDNHIHNIHVGHGEAFPRCEHPPLPRRGRSIKWFKPRKFVVTAVFEVRTSLLFITVQTQRLAKR